MKNLFTSLLTLVVLISIQGISSAQVSFSHSIGGSYYMASTVGAPAIMYSPRLNFLELGDEVTISAGTHLGLGMSYNSREGASSFALDLPLVAEINFGHGANTETRSSFGGFAGFGYGISRMGSAGAFDAEYNNASGLLLNGGVRAIINERPLGFRLSYLVNSKEGFRNVVGVGVFYSLGI